MTPGVTPCPTAQTLERLLGETLGDAERVTVESHVETCSACQSRLEQLVSAGGPAQEGKTTPPNRAEPDEEFLNRLRQLPPRSLTAPTATEETVSVQQLGPYLVLGRLGRGGMGTVYRARHRELDKIVALKVLPADRVDEVAVARFRNEMKAAGRLGHPNIVAATDAGRVDGTYYLAMDFVDGLDLARVVERVGPLPVADACELLRQAADGLRHAHEQGLVHRDVKPSNLMLARGGVVKILDLGLARTRVGEPTPDGLTTSGVILGTADYIAPEQIGNAQAADARADLYSLGVTLFFLLAGSPPFAGDKHRMWLDKLRAHQAEPVPPIRDRRPDVPAALADLLARMVAKEPSDRPATAAAVADALRPFAVGADLTRLLTRAEGIAEPPRPPVSPTATANPSPRSRVGIGRYVPAAVAGAAITLAVAVLLFALGRGEPPPTTAANTPPATSAITPPAEVVRLTFGSLGPTRPDNRVLPGEEVYVEFTFSGIGTDTAGRTDLTFGGELADESGKSIQELLPVPVKGVLALGGATFTGVVNFALPGDFPAGSYTVRVTLNDRLTGKALTGVHPIRVLDPAFGAVKLRYANDREGTSPAGGHLTVGQQLYLIGKAVGFARDGGRIHVTGRFTLRDAAGTATIPAPVTFTVNEKLPEEANRVTFDFSLFANRPGEYVAVVELEDVIGGKTATYQLPLTVHPPRASQPASGR